MKTAESWQGYNATKLPRMPNVRRILLQCEMRTNPVVEGSILVEYPTHVRLVEHNEVIETFPIGPRRDEPVQARHLEVGMLAGIGTSKGQPFKAH